MGQGSSVALSCGVSCRCSSDLSLLRLWRRPAAAAPIGPLAWELPYAMDVALKKTPPPKKIPQLRSSRAGTGILEHQPQKPLLQGNQRHLVKSAEAGTQQGHTDGHSFLCQRKAVMRSRRSVYKGVLLTGQTLCVSFSSCIPGICDYF